MTSTLVKAQVDLVKLSPFREDLLQSTASDWNINDSRNPVVAVYTNPSSLIERSFFIDVDNNSIWSAIPYQFIIGEPDGNYPSFAMEIGPGCLQGQSNCPPFAYVSYTQACYTNSGNDTRIFGFTKNIDDNKILSTLNNPINSIETSNQVIKDSVIYTEDKYINMAKTSMCFGLGLNEAGSSSLIALTTINL